MPVFRTMIVTAADAPFARQLAETLDPGSSSGMWETALAASSAPTVPTHYISTGYVSAGFAAALPLAEWTYEQPDPEQPGTWVRTAYEPGNAAAIVERAAALDPPVVIDQAEVERLFADSDVTTQDPWVAFGRLGLVLVQTQPEIG